MGQMFAIRYEEATESELKELRLYDRRRILDEVDEQLRHEPTMPSRRRKMLSGLVPPWDQVRPVWQLRVGGFRVFYDIDEQRGEVIIRAIRRKGRQTTEEIL